MAVPSVSSYQGNLPKAVSRDVSTLVKSNIVEKDMNLIDRKFHIEGKKRPLVPWFSIRLTGPGAPESIDGEFLWIEGPRYLVIPEWLTDILTSFLLHPARDGVSMQLDPGFCPAVVSQGSNFTKRLITMRSMIIEVLQTWPPGSSRILPPTSLLVFRPTVGNAKVFKLDPKTNQIGVTPLDPAMYKSITSFYILSGSIAFLLAALGTGLFTAWGYRGILKLRKEILYDMKGLSVLLDEIRQVRKDGRTRNEDEIWRERATIIYSEEEQEETISKTGFFNVLEGLAVPVRLLCKLQACADVAADRAGGPRACRGRSSTPSCSWPSPACRAGEEGEGVNERRLTCLLRYVMKTSAEIQMGMSTTRCEFAINKCKCAQEANLFPVILDALAYAQMLVAVIELSSFYLSMPQHALIWKLVRFAFTISYFLLSLLSIFLLLLNGIWIFFGTIVLPRKISPYLIAIVGVAVTSLRYWIRLTQFQWRVKQAIKVRIEQRKSQISVSPTLLEFATKQNLAQV